jgi:hypothetical protein
MTKTKSLADALATNQGIVRQAVNFAVCKYGVAHRLASDARADIAGDVVNVLLTPRGEKNQPPIDAYNPVKGTFVNYLGIISKRAALDIIDKMMRRTHASLDAPMGEGEEGEATSRVDMLASDEPTAEQGIIDAEERIALAAACKSLGASEYLDPEYSHEGYATAHGCTVGAARIRLCRTVDALQELVKK